MRAINLTLVLIPLEYLILVILTLGAEAGYLLIGGDIENSVLQRGNWLAVVFFPFIVSVFRIIYLNYLIVALLLGLFLKNTASHRFGYLARLLVINVIGYILCLGFIYVVDLDTMTEILLPLRDYPMANVMYLTGLVVIISPLVLFYACRRFQKKTVYKATFISAGSIMPLAIIAGWVLVWTTG